MQRQRRSCADAPPQTSHQTINHPIPEYGLRCVDSVSQFWVCISVCHHPIPECGLKCAGSGYQSWVCAGVCWSVQIQCLRPQCVQVFVSYHLRCADSVSQSCVQSYVCVNLFVSEHLRCVLSVSVLGLCRCLSPCDWMWPKVWVLPKTETLVSWRLFSTYFEQLFVWWTDCKLESTFSLPRKGQRGLRLKFKCRLSRIYGLILWAIWNVWCVGSENMGHQNCIYFHRVKTQVLQKLSN